MDISLHCYPSEFVGWGFANGAYVRRSGREVRWEKIVDWKYYDPLMQDQSKACDLFGFLVCKRKPPDLPNYHAKLGND